MELFGAKVVKEDMEGEDVFDGVDGRVGGEEVGHGSVVDGADIYGGAAIDLTGKMREGEVVVEGRRWWVEKERAKGERDGAEKKNKKE